MTSLGTCDIGDEIKVTATFANLAGTLTNPATLAWQVYKPGGTIVAYTQASPEVANPSTGVWTLTFTVTDNLPGRWHVRARGTATVLAADEDWFDVRRSVFATP